MTDISDAADAVESTEIESIFDVSIQKLLNGPGFSEKFMLKKASHELERLKSCKNYLPLLEHIINFSVSVASIADWSFQFLLKDNPYWRGFNEVNFGNWVRSQSIEAAAFMDIANEFKHAHRRQPNFVARKVSFEPDVFPNPLGKPKEKGIEIIQSNDISIYIVPKITYAQSDGEIQKVPLFDAAEAALAWWETIKLDSAVPMDSHFKKL